MAVILSIRTEGTYIVFVWWPMIHVVFTLQRPRQMELTDMRSELKACYQAVLSQVNVVAGPIIFMLKDLKCIMIVMFHTNA